MKDHRLGRMMLLLAAAADVVADRRDGRVRRFGRQHNH